MDELDVGIHEVSEDIMAVKVEYTDENGLRKCVVVVLSYMTTQGDKAARENYINYKIAKKIVNGNMNGKVILMGE